MVRFLRFLSLAVLAAASLTSANAQVSPEWQGKQLRLDLRTPPTPVPAGSAAVTGNPGPRQLYYWVVANFTAGSSIPFGPILVQQAPNALSGTNFVTVFWQRANGASSYDVLRTDTPSAPQGACACAVTTATSSLSTTDQSESLNAYTVSPLDPSSLQLTLNNEAQSIATSHLILRQGSQLVADLSIPGGASSVGEVNVVTDCGMKNDNATDIFAVWNACHALYKNAHFLWPGCGFAPQGGGTANIPCYFSSGRIVASYNGTVLEGPNPSTWNGIVSIRYPSGVGGIRLDTNCYGCKVANLGVVGGDQFSGTDLSTWPDWTPATLVGDGPDGIQMLGGSQILENVAVYSFGRHGIFLDGTSNILPSSQPDAWRISGVIVDANRANGIFLIGCDSNVGLGQKILSRGNMLSGIYDYSCLGNTWISPDSALDGRSAIVAGATSNIATISDNGAGVLTITTATPVASWQSTGWVTVVGTVNYNGTYKVTGGTSSNFTANYLGTPQAGEAVGTAAKASSTEVFATLTARSAAAGQAPTIECAYGSRSGSSTQVWINPYQESNSAPPCWDSGTLVVGGQLASTKTSALGQGFTWITNVNGGLFVKGGQAFTFQNPADSLTTFNLRAGATALQDISIRFMAFDGTIKHTLKLSSVGSAFTLVDTSGVSWLGKTPGSTAFMRGGSATEDITFNQSSGRDELHYCGTASVCAKLLNTDLFFYFTGIKSLTASPAGAGFIRVASADVFGCQRNAANNADKCFRKTGAVSGGISADSFDVTDFAMVKLPARLMTSGTAPTCTFTSGGGTSPSCAAQTGSTDSAGVIVATTGTGSPGSSGDITLTFSAAYGTNAPACTWTVSLAAAGQWNARASAMDKTPTTSSDVMHWDNNAVALGTSTAFNLNYTCIAK